MADYITSWRFRVILNGTQYGFSKVSNLSSEMEYDAVTEGGRNNAPLLFRKPPGKRGTLVLEHGIKRGADNKAGEIVKMGTAVREFLVYVDEERKSRTAARIYSIDDGVVTKVELGDLDAGESKLFLERIEIAHTGFVLVKT